MRFHEAVKYLAEGKTILSKEDGSTYDHYETLKELDRMNPCELDYDWEVKGEWIRADSFGVAFVKLVKEGKSIRSINSDDGDEIIDTYETLHELEDVLRSEVLERQWEYRN